MDNEMTANEFSLETLVTNAAKVPGVKVNRSAFLAKTFPNDPDLLKDILTAGPIEAGISREELNKIAKKQIMFRTSESSAASFLTGIPGGLAMGVTVPADVLQFFGMTLRLAQELSYLYGAQDLWQDGEIDDERVRNQLILYCGVMFGVSGAATGVRVLSTQIAKTTLKKLPQKALTKTFWYPIVKKICAAIGVKVTKTTVAKGISNAIPVVGGVISGSLNFVSMKPMADRLHDTLDKSCFEYTQEDLDADCEELENIPDFEEVQTPITLDSVKEKAADVAKDAGKTAKEFGSKLSGAAKKFLNSKKTSSAASDDPVAALKKLQELFDAGIITEDEFTAKKQELLARL